MAKLITPQEAIPGDARYWLYVSDGYAGRRIGWATSNTRARTWLRGMNAGAEAWIFDREQRRYTFCRVTRARATWWSSCR